MSGVLHSVFLGRDRELLPLLFDFYAPEARVVRDVTANARRMWVGVALPRADLRFYDVDPEVRPDVVCGWGALPDADGSVDVLVYDPPHLPLAAASPKSMRRFAGDYGLGHSVKADNVAALHPPFLREAARVLSAGGLIFAKVKDYVHNHRYQWNLHALVEQVRAAGLTPCDLIIKKDPSGGSLRSGRWERIHHARNGHCYWLIVRKGRCEPAKSGTGAVPASSVSASGVEAASVPVSSFSARRCGFLFMYGQQCQAELDHGGAHTWDVDMERRGPARDGEDLGICPRPGCGGILVARISTDGTAWEADCCPECSARWWHDPPRSPSEIPSASEQPRAAPPEAVLGEAGRMGNEPDGEGSDLEDAPAEEER